MIVDEGEAPPVSVTGPEGLLLDVPARVETKANTTRETGTDQAKPRGGTGAGSLGLSFLTSER